MIVVHGGVIGRILAEAAGSTNGFAFVGADNGSISHVVVMPTAGSSAASTTPPTWGWRFSTSPEPLT